MQKHAWSKFWPNGQECLECKIFANWMLFFSHTGGGCNFYSPPKQKKKKNSKPMGPWEGSQKLKSWDLLVLLCRAPAEEEAAALQDDVHVVPAGGAGEGVPEDALPRRLLPRGTRAAHWSHRGQSAGQSLSTRVQVSLSPPECRCVPLHLVTSHTGSDLYTFRCGSRIAGPSGGKHRSSKAGAGRNSRVKVSQ